LPQADFGTRTPVVAVDNWLGDLKIVPENARMEVSMPLPQIYVEKTLALIKPDVVDKEEEIQDIILGSGFTIIQVTSAVSFIRFPLFLYKCSHPIRSLVTLSLHF
jgi:hypothetical protein